MKQNYYISTLATICLALLFFLCGLIPGNSEFGLAWEAYQVGKERLHDIGSKAPNVEH
jgi:hypothetical protein